METLGSFVWAFLMLGLGVWLYGLTTQLMWLWFVVYTFGLPALSFWQAFGLMIFTKWMCPMTDYHNAAFDKIPVWFRQFILNVLTPGIVLLGAWLVAHFALGVA